MVSPSVPSWRMPGAEEDPFDGQGRIVRNHGAESGEPRVAVGRERVRRIGQSRLYPDAVDGLLRRTCGS